MLIYRKMWVVCKKRKLHVYNYTNKSIKKTRFYPHTNHNKRKINNVFVVIEKKQKCDHNFYHCVLHKEKYICDIYDCSGLNENKNIIEDHMPYII
jgi:hypothetical protein